ncbi:hypothetical protein ACFV0H_38835 [Streptomyces erythrochromogenes]|uniref:Uncharacterized protein n=1 Tax=Streptomyces erythrochromogenes TaxID=285574 RepID=A0ABZ1Q875_9ACTN|nr:hypothetical protein [Streptomyces erythrochromogenes]MCX5582190.1 hypothetical protein [Streptomyces erythrochromogenes]
MNEGDQPDLDEIDARFAAVAEGRTSRDAADRWAARWVDDTTLDWDDLSWWALQLLHGIDLRPGPGEPYLHDDEQVRDWLRELRRRRAGRPAEES